MFMSIFAILSRATSERPLALRPIAGILRTGDAEITAKIKHTVQRLRFGSGAVLVTGQSAAALSCYVKALLLSIRADRAIVNRQTVTMRAQCLSSGQDLRPFVEKAPGYLLTIEDLHLLRPEKIRSIVRYLKQFVHRGGQLLVTTCSPFPEDLPEKWSLLEVPDLSNRRIDALLIWEQLALEGFAPRLLTKDQVLLMNHTWSNGLSDLIETVESVRILSITSGRTVVKDGDLSAILQNPGSAGMHLRTSHFLSQAGLYRLATEIGMDQMTQVFQGIVMAKAMKECENNVAGAASLLKVPVSTLVSRIRAAGIGFDACKRWSL